jgi:hypothetical protein
MRKHYMKIPNHFDALHFLGVIAYQTKNLRQRHQARLAPDHIVIWN